MVQGLSAEMREFWRIEQATTDLKTWFVQGCADPKIAQLMNEQLRRGKYPGYSGTLQLTHTMIALARHELFNGELTRDSSFRKSDIRHPAWVSQNKIFVAPFLLPGGKKVTLETLKPGRCCFPNGTPGDPDFHYCGHQCKKGSKYCQVHHRVMHPHTPPRPIKLRGADRARAVLPPALDEETHELMGTIEDISHD